MKGFILKVKKDFKSCVMISFLYADAVFEKFRPETGGWIWKKPLQKKKKKKKNTTSWGVDPSAILSELATYLSLFWCKKRVLWYTLHNIPSY